MRTLTSWFLGLVVLGLAGCPTTNPIECRDDLSCDLFAGGVCVGAATGNQWCAFPDPLCPSGLRFSDYRVGDGLANQCVNAEADAGIDGPIDGPSDITPPTILSHSPVALAANVPIAAAVSVTFSEDIRAASVTATSFDVRAGATLIGGRIQVTGAMASFVPDARMSTATTYTVTIGTGVTDLAGNPLAQAVTWTFQTGSGGWTPRQLLEMDLTHSAADLQVSFNRAGQGVATWNLDTAYFARYGASAWAPAAAIPGLATVGAVAIDPQGKIVAATTGPALLATRFDGVSWSAAPVRIDANVGSLPSGVDIAADAAGNVVAVWAQTEGATAVTSVWANRFTVASGWGTATRLESNATSTSRPDVAVLTDGSAAAVWIQSDMLHVARMLPDGQWVATPTPLGPATFARPTVTAGPSSTAITLWRNGNNLNASRYSGAWSSPASIAGGGMIFEGQQVFIGSNGRAVALWMAGSAGFQDLMQSVFVPASGWGPPSTIDVLAGAVNAVAGTAGSGDRILAGWIQYQGGPATPKSGWGAVFDATGWGEPQLFETDDAGSVIETGVYYDTATNTYGAVWIQGGGANLPSLYFSELR